MYPSDVLAKVEAMEMTAEDAERATRVRLLAHIDLLWPNRTWQLTEEQYQRLREYVFDPHIHRSSVEQVRMGARVLLPFMLEAYRRINSNSTSG